MDRVHRPTWLCPDAASRERLLDMDERLKRPRAVAFALIAIGIGAAVPLIGWWGLGLLLVAVLGFRLAQGIAERIRAPEHALFASWAVSELVIAGSVAVTGGITSYTACWLLVPLVTLPARFGTRGVGAGVAFIAVLVIAIAVAIEPGQPLPAIYALFALLTTLTAVSVLSTALMRSDVDHRTEAVIDGLTGMLNRRALDQRLHELTAQARITGQPVAVIASDIDHFKRVNDEHGHAAGDAVLVEVAYRLRKALRAFDLAYRVGGEEFLVVLPGAGVPDATRLAEQMREAVAAEPAAGLQVTMSFGVAGSVGPELERERLLDEADAALYEAKARGRDQVVAATAALAGGCRINQSANRRVNQSRDNTGPTGLKRSAIWEDANETAEISCVRPTVARAT
jgi:diguanylate cyclase (GGDEF)-like protein